MVSFHIFVKESVDKQTAFERIEISFTTEFLNVRLYFYILSLAFGPVGQTLIAGRVFLEYNLNPHE
jgi:hypothetical protein